MHTFKSKYNFYYPLWVFLITKNVRYYCLSALYGWTDRSTLVFLVRFCRSNLPLNKKVSFYQIMCIISLLQYVFVPLLVFFSTLGWVVSSSSIANGVWSTRKVMLYIYRPQVVLCGHIII